MSASTKYRLEIKHKALLEAEEPRARLLTDLEDSSFADAVRLIATYILDLVDFNCGFDIS